MSMALDRVVKASLWSVAASHFDVEQALDGETSQKQSLLGIAWQRRVPFYRAGGGSRSVGIPAKCLYRATARLTYDLSCPAVSQLPFAIDVSA